MKTSPGFLTYSPSRQRIPFLLGDFRQRLSMATDPGDQGCEILDGAERSVRGIAVGVCEEMRLVLLLGRASMH